MKWLRQNQTQLCFFADSLKPLRDAMLFNPVFRPQVEQFWNVQEKILDEAEEFTRYWLQRRHAVEPTALKVARTAVSGESEGPKEAVKALSEWQRHSAERVAEDSRERLETMSRCVRLAGSMGAEAVGEMAEKR